MDSLPRELIELILFSTVRMCRCDKNIILNLRLVCKAFDIALRPYGFKTIQLEFSRFLRHEPTPDVNTLENVGPLCQAVYMDLMVVRDEEEITRLNEVFHGIIAKVPEMVPLLDSLRKYCMNEKTFDETDFRRVLEGVFAATPNMTRLKLNLPFQVVGKQSLTATLLLATVLDCVAKRPEEFKRPETMVLDHVSDTTVNNICNNPMDLSNAITAFAELKHLIISIKRQEMRNSRQATFTHNLWFLIRKAFNLESLCIIGWNTKRDISSRRHLHGVTFNEWMMKSLPYNPDPLQALNYVRFLELKRVDVDPRSFLALIEEVANTLKELYLNEVYLKVFGTREIENSDMWIGHIGSPRAEKACWVAEDLRNMPDLELDVLRVTGLGYDDFAPERNPLSPAYDLVDPKGLNRIFDQRFVEAVFGLDDVVMTDAPPSASATKSTSRDISTPHRTRNTLQPVVQPPIVELPQTNHNLNETQAHTEPLILPGLPPLSETHQRKPVEYDAETYQQTHNTTSHFKRCIDGYFFNHNEQALKELQRIITVADRGMNLIAAEIDRTHALQFNPTDGNLADPGPLI